MKNHTWTFQKYILKFNAFKGVDLYLDLLLFKHVIFQHLGNYFVIVFKVVRFLDTFTYTATQILCHHNFINIIKFRSYFVLCSSLSTTWLVS